MYYEEKVVDGVLCYRGTPDSEWVQFTQQELTSQWQHYKDEYEESHAGWMTADAKLRKTKVSLQRILEALEE